MEVHLVMRDGDPTDLAIKAAYISKEEANADAKRRNSLQSPFARQYFVESWSVIPTTNQFAEARKQFCDLLLNDPEMYRVYSDNVAMTLNDAQGDKGSLDLQDYEIRNKVAERVMEHIFGHIVGCDVGMPVQVSE